MSGGQGMNAALRAAVRDRAVTPPPTPESVVPVASRATADAGAGQVEGTRSWQGEHPVAKAIREAFRSRAVG